MMDAATDAPPSPTPPAPPVLPDDEHAYRYNPQDLVASYEALKSNDVLLQSDITGEPKTRNARPSLVVAATQLSGHGLAASSVEGFLLRAEEAIEKAVKMGATVVLLPELWSGPYFCQSQQACCMNLADPLDNSNVLVARMKALAAHYRIVLPVSIYERKNTVLYNSVVVIDADGSVLGTYRKSSIPDGPGYQEKFYFTPGDTGYKVFDTTVGRIGVAICWDQWFPEVARALSLQGADCILYPTAIGSEPHDPKLDSSAHWQRVMQGHAAANMVPVVASNRYGTEIVLDQNGVELQRICFYGKSFITNNTGAIVAECKDNGDQQGYCTVVTAKIDVDRNRQERAAWGVFRDRRPELYHVLLTKDGTLSTQK